MCTRRSSVNRTREPACRTAHVRTFRVARLLCRSGVVFDEAAHQQPRRAVRPVGRRGVASALLPIVLERGRHGGRAPRDARGAALERRRRAELYERFGFRVAGVRRDYYSQPGRGRARPVAGSAECAGRSFTLKPPGRVARSVDLRSACLAATARPTRGSTPGRSDGRVTCSPLGRGADFKEAEHECRSARAERAAAADRTRSFTTSPPSTTNSKIACTNSPPSTTSQNPNNSKKSPSRSGSCSSKTAWKTSCASIAAV